MAEAVAAEAREKLKLYNELGYLGAGTFAEVSRYYDTVRKFAVAIKRVRKVSFKEGINLGAIKELQALQELDHPNVLKLFDSFVYGDRIHLVLEYCPADLSALIRDRTLNLTEAHVKCVMQQILRGAAYLHNDARMMHRDIKPENILVGLGGVLKLADFGHAARLPDRGAEEPLFHHVVTVWYRPPELLCRAPFHTPAVDVWSLGCVFAELLLRQPLFPSPDPGSGPERDAIERRGQLAAIFRLLGTPVDDPLQQQPLLPRMRDSMLDACSAVSTAVAVAADDYGHPTAISSDANAEASGPANVWPGCASLPGFCEFEARAPLPWADIMRSARSATPLALDLLARMLQYDPRRRIRTADALAHPWFASAPLPTAPSELPLTAAARDAMPNAA